MWKSLVNNAKLTKNRCWVAVIPVIWLIVVHLYTLVEVPASRMLRGVVLLEDDRQVFLVAPNGRSILLTSRKCDYSTGFFVDGSGLIETRWNHPEQLVNHLSEDSLLAVLGERLDSTRRRLAELELLHDEMVYYRQTHDTIESGYEQVMMLDGQIIQEADSLSILTDVLAQVLDAGDAEFNVEQHLSAYYRPTLADTLLRLEAEDVDATHCRLKSGDTPQGAYVFNTTSFRWWNEQRMVLGYSREPVNTSDSLAFIPHLILLDGLPDTIALPNVLSGAPVVDARAHLHAVCTAEGLSSAGGFSINPLAWWRSVRQMLEGFFASEDEYGPTPSPLNFEVTTIEVVRSTSLYADTINAVFTGVVGSGKSQYGRLDYADGSHYLGYLQDGRRNGHGTYTDSHHRQFIGEWDNDTLPRGERLQKNLRFIGTFDPLLRPAGVGVLSGREFYAGEWVEGKRHGAGIGLIPGKIIGYGIWKNDAFFGEPIHFDSNRVYGVDISRYQHEQGRSIYPINWGKMYVDGIGARYKQSVSPDVEFPIRFCYMKATEGVRTESKYSTSDAIDARQAGVRVGHYHFFSPLGGKEQALWFLQIADLQQGDLPPMLDVELNKRQIISMGGIGRLFAEMEEWIRLVKERTHTQPVLYVNQSFADEYMHLAPEEVSKCPLWVARYSACRPTVRQDIWQFTDIGSIAGIRGRVDLNVFNGSLQSFEQFVADFGIK